MRNSEMATLLRELNNAKLRIKDIKKELTIFLVEGIGLSQKEARESNVESIIDGYLIGQGVIQTWRISKEETE